MPRECMFCICVCAGSDIWKMDKNKAKTDKNEHENGKCQKPKPGKSKSQRKSSKFQNHPWRIKDCQKWSLEQRFKSWQNQSLIFQRLSILVLWRYFGEMTTQALKLSKIDNKSPWKLILKIYRFSPCCLHNYISGPCKLILGLNLNTQSDPHP